jgi:hypothetical protein
MLRKITLLAMMLVFAFGVAALAGCGGDDEKSSSGGSSSQSDDSGGGSSDDSGGGGGTDVSDNPQVKQAVESCKQAVTGAPGLKDDTKKDLEELCDKAASGDIDDVQAASVEVCEKIVEDTVPAGSSQDQAKEACKAAAP